MNTRIIDLKGDLCQIVEQINNAAWDASNDLSKYEVESLRAYLQRQVIGYTYQLNT